MHEYSVVQALLEQCESEARKAGASRVLKISVKVGKMSGVEPKLLQSAYSVFSEDSFCKGAVLEITRQNVIARCEKCGEESEIADTRYICPVCGDERLKVIDGDSLILMRLEAE
ncbi:MAG: hydrogenase maturation nickel metallochaperone HypA [Helicobacteraceae bacterium]|jgi:hydrogenase nickel incorporation protein HypA/HybF|nr:hydrogenase maturation nickel metallochaperone HypA [Helicobacteraceae bacterium]